MKASADVLTQSDDTPRQTRGGWIALGLLALLGAVFALPRVQASNGLQLAFGAAILGFGGWLTWLKVSGRALAVQRWMKPAHFVQTGVQLGVYGYWAAYWAPIRAQVPLILAQIVFLMLFEACLSWTLRRQYRFGFTATPVVGSINLFLWFRDPLFILQFALIIGAYLSKEYLKWDREGRRVHIFNPSAIVLAITGIILIVSGTAHHTWAGAISVALGNPPYAYGNIFLMGLVVLSLVPSVLITISGTLTIIGLGWLFHQSTGVYRFVDTGIPIAVWLAMTLLATDPATTPRKGLGKVIFGVLYGCSVYLLYGLLRGIERPPTPDDPGLHVSFFDKLLFLPILNLSVQWIDRLAGAIQPRLAALWPKLLQHNLLHLGVWVGVFVLVRPLLVDHPGRAIEFWESACEREVDGACVQLLDRYENDCETLKIAEACHNAGVMRQADVDRARPLFAAGCEHGLGRACVQASQLSATPAEGLGYLTRACTLGEGSGCEQLARYGMSLLRDAPGEAAKALQPACDGGQGVACANLAVVYQRGQGVPPDRARAEALRRRACTLGVQRACGWR